MIQNMPKIGFGTWKIITKEDVENSIKAACNEYGYQLIDTAQIYNNEFFIGNALKKYKVNLDNLFITSKVWVANFKYHTQASIKESIRRLGVKQIDLMLLHASAGNEINLIAYKELIKARNSGLIRYFGVSNWNVDDIRYVYEKTGEMPYANQIIASPINRMKKLEAFCTRHNIKLTAYSTVRPYYNPNEYYEKYSTLTKDQKKIIEKFARHFKVTPSQIMLKWALQNDYYIIPKSIKPTHIRENIDLNHFVLTEYQMDTLNKMSQFGDNEFSATMKVWESFTRLTDAQYKSGLLFDKTYQENIHKK